MSNIHLSKRNKKLVFRKMMEPAPIPRWMIDQDLEWKQSVNYSAIFVLKMKNKSFLLNIGE